MINDQQFTFIPLRYKRREIFIKTPKISVPFGLNIYTTGDDRKCYYYVLSLTDRDIDPNIENFYQFIKKTEQFCCTTVSRNWERWGCVTPFDQLQFKSSLKDTESPLFRLKIIPTVTEIYDEKNDPHDVVEIEQLITRHCQIISLIEMNNIWINSSEYGMTWKVHQIKIYPTTRPSGGISLLNESVQVFDQPPQPPPPPPLMGAKVQRIPIFPMINCLAMITSGDYKLNKVNTEHKTSLQPQISLDEILKIRKNLKCNKST